MKNKDENHRPEAPSKPQVYRQVKKRHTIAASVSSASPARRRQATLLSYSTDPRQRHDASVELVPGLALPPPPQASSSRSSLGSSKRSAPGSGKADLAQRKLTDFGVGGIKKEVNAVNKSSMADATAHQDDARLLGPDTTGSVNVNHGMAVDGNWVPRQSVPGCGFGGYDACRGVPAVEQRSSVPPVSSPPRRIDTVRDRIHARISPATSPAARHQHQPASLVTPPRPPQRAPSLLLADLPAAPQYFEVLPRLAYYPPSPPSTDIPKPPPPLVTHEPPMSDQPQDPLRRQQQYEVGSAQQRIDQARAQRRPVTLDLIVDVWREQLAVEMRKAADLD